MLCAYVRTSHAIPLVIVVNATAMLRPCPVPRNAHHPVPSDAQDESAGACVSKDEAHVRRALARCIFTAVHAPYFSATDTRSKNQAGRACTPLPPRAPRSPTCPDSGRTAVPAPWSASRVTRTLLDSQRARRIYRRIRRESVDGRRYRVCGWTNSARASERYGRYVGPGAQRAHLGRPVALYGRARALYGGGADRSGSPRGRRSRAGAAVRCGALVAPQVRALAYMRVRVRARPGKHAEDRDALVVCMTRGAGRAEQGRSRSAALREEGEERTYPTGRGSADKLGAGRGRVALGR